METKAEVFNQKYNLGNLNSKWFDNPSKEENANKKTVSLSGKPKKISVDVIKRFFSNKWNILFLGLLILIILMIIIGPYFTSYTSNKPTTNAGTNQIAYVKPDWVHNWDVLTINIKKADFNSGASIFNGHMDSIISKESISQGRLHITYHNWLAPRTLLGTDVIGRDVWTRMWVGAAWSLELAIFVAIVETIIGVSIGIYIGFHAGKAVDTLMMRIIELFNSIPGILWLFVFVIILGTGFWSMVIALVIVGAFAPVYSARFFTIKLKDAEFIKAAESIGVSKASRLYRHILPNIIGRLLVSFVHRIPAVIFYETTLVFLGLKVGGASTDSIGNLIADARQLPAITYNPYYAVSISMVLLLFTVSLQIIANGIRDAFDPRIGGK